jgi:hypothetical protein
MWDEVKSLSSKKRTNSFIRKHTMKGNGTKGKTFQRGKNSKGVVTLLRPTPTSLVFCLMITYFRIFLKYLKDILLVSLIKKFKNLFDS